MKPFQILLLCSVALVVSSCGETREFLREKYTGERKGTPVVGERRMPVLNAKAKDASRPAVKLPPLAAPQTAPTPSVVPTEPVAKTATKAPTQPSPYDQFDAKGNEVKTNEKSVFQRWFGGDDDNDNDDEKSGASVASNTIFSLRNEEPRKKFRGNNGIIIPSEETASVAVEQQKKPIPEKSANNVAAISEPLPVVGNVAVSETPKEPAHDLTPIMPAAITLSSEPNNELAPEISEATPLLAPAEQAPEVHSPDIGNGVIIPLPTSQLKAEATSPMVLASAEAPALADVPPTPTAFKEVKATKNEEQKQLLDDHAQAMDGKVKISEEPSELQLPQDEKLIEENKHALTPAVPAAAAQ